MAGDEDRKKELIAQLALARRHLDTSGAAVKRALDVPARIRSGFQRHAYAWIGGAILIGVILAKLPPRTRKVYVNEEGQKVKTSSAGKAGLFIAASKIAFDLCRPFLRRWITENAAPVVEKWVAQYIPSAKASDESYD